MEERVTTREARSLRELVEFLEKAEQGLDDYNHMRECLLNGEVADSEQVNEAVHQEFARDRAVAMAVRSRDNGGGITIATYYLHTGHRAHQELLERIASDEEWEKRVRDPLRKRGTGEILIKDIRYHTTLYQPGLDED